MSHREQALYDRAGWRPVLLIPAWTVQILLMLGIAGLFAYRLADTFGSRADEGHTLDVPVVLVVWECTNVGFSLLALILTFVEIGKYAAETLTPFAMLVIHIIKVMCSCGNLAVDIAVHVILSHGPWSKISLVMGSGLAVITFLTLIYSIIIDRRVSKYEEYSHTANVKHYGFNTNDDTAYPSQTTRLPTAIGSDGRSSTETSLEETQRPDGHRHSSAPSVFSISTLKHSLSIGPRKRESTAEADLGDGVAGQEPIALDALSAKRTSYNHERSTEFDEFLRRHSSVGFNSLLGRVREEDPDWGNQDGGSRAPAAPTTAPQPTAAIKPGRRSTDSTRSLSHETHLTAVSELPDEEDGEEEKEPNDALLPQNTARSEARDGQFSRK